MLSRNQKNRRPHKTGKRERKQKEKAAAKEKRVWSANRPTLPESDDLFEEIISSLEARKNTIWGEADAVGLSESTMRKYHARATRYPRAISLQMMAKAMGGRLVFIRTIKGGKS